ncbi:hypothetical protein GEMRC1_007158 [Eukaryota sp. GEM-RC1]
MFLLELELYGYQLYTCLTPVDVNKGITSLEEETEETTNLTMGDEISTSIQQFQNYIATASHLISESHLSYSLFLVSPNCFHAQAPVTITLTPSTAVELIFVENYLKIDANSLNLVIPVLCIDCIGFSVDSLGNLTVHNSTVIWTSFELFSNDLIFFSISTFTFGHYFLELEFLGQTVQTSITIAQKFAYVLNISTFEVFDCSNQMLFDKACTLIKPSVFLNIHHDFFTSSRHVSLSNVVTSSSNDQAIIVVVDDMLEVISYPLQSMTITLSYFAQFETVNLLTNDCRFPKLNSRDRCLCSKGMEFNFLGECVECSLNYYSNLEFNSECRSCPFPRITLQKGSSDLDHCVCPLNTLDSVGSCLPCLHLPECGFGNLTGIEPGFRLNTDTWELDDCVFWFNCHENSCRSRHAYGG